MQQELNLTMRSTMRVGAPVLYGGWIWQAK